MVSWDLFFFCRSEYLMEYFFSYIKAQVTRWSFYLPYVLRPTELLAIIINRNLPLCNGVRRPSQTIRMDHQKLKYLSTIAFSHIPRQVKSIDNPKELEEIIKCEMVTNGRDP